MQGFRAGVSTTVPVVTQKFEFMPAEAIDLQNPMTFGSLRRSLRGWRVRCLVWCQWMLRRLSLILLLGVRRHEVGGVRGGVAQSGVTDVCKCCFEGFRPVLDILSIELVAKWCRGQQFTMQNDN